MENQEPSKGSSKERPLLSLARRVGAEAILTLTKVEDDNFKRGLYRNLLHDFLNQLNDLDNK